MSVRNDDPISPELRQAWMIELLRDNGKVRIYTINDDFDDDSLPLVERTRIWARKMDEVSPPFQVVASSEDFSERFAIHLGAIHIPFDPGRKVIRSQQR